MTDTYIPVKVRREVLARDSFKCVWCGRKEEHDVGCFVQKQAGGVISETNVITQCEVCKRKRHYDSPSEFIDTLKLEKINIYEEVTMLVKVTFPDTKRSPIEGEVDNYSVPQPNTKAFYLRSIGNGKRTLVFVEPGMVIEELGGKEKGGREDE